MTQIMATQRRQSSTEFKFPANESNRFMASSTNKNLLNTTTSDLGFRESDRHDSVEAKMLQNVEIRRHSFPGLVPYSHSQSGITGDRFHRASLDSIVSKSVAKHSSSSLSSQSHFKSPPVSWLDSKGSLQKTLPSMQFPRQSPISGDSSNPSSPESDSSGTPATPGGQGLSLPAINSLSTSNSRARYSPMFMQHDSFSSPFSAPTIFDKVTATAQSKPKDPKQYWKPADPPSVYQGSASLGIGERAFESRLQVKPPASDRSQIEHASIPPTSSTSSVIRSALYGDAPISGPPSKPLIQIMEHEPKKPEETSDPHAEGSVTSKITKNENNRSGFSTVLPDISRLSLIDPHIGKAPLPKEKTEGGHDRDRDRDHSLRLKSARKFRKEGGDSDADTDRSETDTDSGDIQERDLSGIDASSEFDSEDDPSRLRSFWQAKRELYKTEICLNWLRTRNCSYGNKCHYAHGMADLRTRQRIETYKTQPCADPARNGCHVCMYTSRCNYAHPGEPIRRMGPYPGKKYFDPEYFEALRRDYPCHEMPFGVFV